MKITPSNDGEMRGRLKVAFNISLRDVVDAIVLKITSEWNFDSADNVAMKVETALKFYSSRSKIIEDVKDAFWKNGVDLWARVENCTSEYIIKEIEEQARILVLKKFPQFKKP
jgi:hypothetical protein